MRTRGKPWFLALLLVMAIGLVPGLAIAEDSADGQAAPDASSSSAAVTSDGEDAEAVEQPDAAATNEGASEGQAAADGQSAAKSQDAKDPEEADNGAKDGSVIALTDAEYPWDDENLVVGTIGVDKSVQVELDNNVVWYTFAPQESGMYRFFTTDANNQAAVELFDNEGNVIDFEKSSSSSENGKEVVFALEGSQAYYLRASTDYPEGEDSYELNVELYTEDDPDNPGDETLYPWDDGGPGTTAIEANQSVFVELNGASAWYTFTPAESGRHVIRIENGNDPVVDLYHEQQPVEPEGDDECVWDLDAGKTYFLRASTHNDGIIDSYTLTVTTNDIQAAQVAWRSKYLYTGKPVALRFELTFKGETLVEGEDYELIYEDEDCNEIEGAPTDRGAYLVYARGLTDACPGETNQYWFCITDAYELNWITLGSDVYEETDSAVELDIEEVDDENGDAVDPDGYKLLFYKSTGEWDEEENSYVYEPIEGAPTEAGEYQVAAMGIGDYTGETNRESFSIVNSHDLTDGDIGLSKDVYAVGENPVEIQIEYVENVLGDEVPDNAYELLYYDAVENEDEPYTYRSDAPSEIGEYGVAAKGVDPYSGTTKIHHFSIVDANSLSLAYLGIDDYSYVYAGQAITPEVYVELPDGTTLDPSKYDLVYIKHVYSEEDSSTYTLQELTSTPSEIGEYEVYAEAKSGSGYSGRTSSEEFVIVDGNDLAYAHIDIHPNSVAYTGSPVQFDVNVTRADGTEIDSASYNLVYYADSDESDAVDYIELDEPPTEPGEYWVAAEASGEPYYGRTYKMNLSIYDPSSLTGAQVSLKQESYSYTGSPVAPAVSEVYLPGADDFEFPETAYELVYYTGEWDDEEDDYTYTELDSAPTEIGDYYVAARGAGTNAGESDKTLFRIVGVNNLAAATVEFSGYKDYADWGYHFYAKGTNIDERITIALGETPLTLGADYVLRYYKETGDEETVELDGCPTEPGWYLVYAEGTGNDDSGYCGQTSNGFFTLVEPNDLRLADVDLTQDTYTYTGSDITPELTVTMNGTLVSSDNYQLLYYSTEDDEELDGAPVAVGEYHGRGVVQGDAYTGQFYVPSFVITPKSVTVTANAASKKAGQDDPEFTATVEGLVGTDTIDYTVSCEHGDEPGTYTITVSGEAEQGNYAVTFENGTFTIEAADTPAKTSLAGAAVTVSGSYEFTGAPVEPGAENVAVTLDGAEVPASGYDVACSDNVDAGTATVTVTGKGDYEGTATGTFEIARKAATVTANDVTKKAGEPDPELTATVEGLVGTDTVDYTVSREPGDEPGTYTITVSGEAEQGNYAVTFENGTFTIEAADTPAKTSLEGAAVTVSGSYEFTGDEIWPEAEDVAVTLDGAEVPASGYDVAYTNNRNAGTATVTVTGKGDYEGTATGTFEIARKAVTVTANEAGKTADAPDPKFTATIDGVLPEDEESITYTVSCEHGDEPGTYTIIVSGEAEQGNYAVTFENGTFTIMPAVLNRATVTVAGATYTGKALTPKVSVKLINGKDVPSTGYDVEYQNNVNAGTATVIVTGKGEYTGAAQATFKIAKAANGLTAKGKSVKVKAKKVKKKAQKVAATKAIAVSGAQGKVTYKLTKVTAKKKLAKQAKKKIKMAANGQITLKKGLKKGTYKLTVQVSAAGDGNYNAGSKTVTVKIKVK